MNIVSVIIYFSFLANTKSVESNNIQKIDNDNGDSEIHLCKGVLGNQCQTACASISNTAPRCEESKCLCQPEGDCRWHILKFIRILEPLASDENYGSCSGNYPEERTTQPKERIVPKPKICDVGAEGHCTYLCEGVGFKYGRCYNEKCQCSTARNENRWVDLTTELEENYKTTACEESYKCSRYCRRFLQSPYQCTNEICSCDETRRSDKTTEIQIEIYEKCENPQRENIDCKHKCLQLGNKNGICKVETNRDRRCHCQNHDDQWKPLEEKDYLYGGRRIDRKDQFEKDIDEGPCAEEACDIGCYEKRQFGGQCKENICRCKTSRNEDKWTESKEIVHDSKKYTPSIRFCDTKHGEGYCHYRCRGLRYLAGRCKDNVCQCTPDDRYWYDLKKDVEEQYQTEICHSEYGDELCGVFCRHIKNTTGKCNLAYCDCDESKKDDETTQIQKEIDGLCEEDGRLSLDCRYKCRELGHYNGNCRTGSGYLRRCQCLNTENRWNELTTNDYYENGERKDNEEELEPKILTGPCIAIDCDMGCHLQRQFSGKCISNVCQCKISRKRSEYYEYKNILTENRIETRTMVLEENSEELVNRLCKTEYGEGDCNYRCEGVGHIAGRCNDQRCQCTNDRKNWFDYTQDMEQNYEDNVCPTYAGVPSCSRYCVRIKGSPGECLDKKCHCSEEIKSLEDTKIDNEIEELCQDPSKNNIFCNYKCKSLVFMKGVCEKSSKKMECYCEDTNQNWKRLNRSNFYEHGHPTYMSHRDDFLQKIQNGPCNSSDCEYGCFKEHQFGSRCQEGTCQCKISNDANEWRNYEAIVTEKRRDILEYDADTHRDITEGTREISCTSSTSSMCAAKCLYNSNNRYDSGECKDYVCQCYDRENNKWDRLREKDDGLVTYQNVCQNEIGEGNCNYRCVGLGYIRGRCNGKKCQCLEKEEKWIDVTPELEEQFRNSVCKVENGEDNECTRYCWRFKHGSGECKKEICKCNESDRNDDHSEINNEIQELCENIERENLDCRSKCKELDMKNGDCRMYNSQSACFCEDQGGNWKPLTRDNYYNEDGRRIDDRNHYEQDIIEKPCTMPACNVACYKQKQFAGECVKGVCNCKITRDGQSWRSYQTVLDANRHDEVVQHEAACAVKVCQSRCRGVQRNGDCMDDVCKCYDTNQQQWKNYTELLEDIAKPGDPKYEACLRDAGEGTCNYLCEGVGYTMGKCDGKICQCLSNLKQWVDLTEIIENDFMISVCSSDQKDDCSKYCWRFARTSGECQGNTCTCNKKEMNNELVEIQNDIEELCQNGDRKDIDCSFKCVHLGKTNGTCELRNSKYICNCLDCDEIWEPLEPKDFYEEGERIDNKEIENADIILGTCSPQECDVACIRQKQFSGSCRAGICECQVTHNNGTWYTYKHIVEEHKFYEERTEVLDICSDSKKCSRVCRREGCKRGSCIKERCQCTENTGDKEYIDAIVKKNRHEGEDILQACTNNYKCNHECLQRKWESGECSAKRCECTDKNKRKDYLENIINPTDNKEKESDICHIETGEGHCNYRCVGLGYIKGRCNGKKCQCLENGEKWIDLTPTLEDQIRNSVCKVQNGEDKQCSRYCWRLQQSPANCENKICKCDESKRNDEHSEISNEIEGLCEDKDRKNVDCKFKCKQLGNNKGDCRMQNSQRTCFCEDSDGSWKRLTEDNYYDEEGKRIDNRVRQEQDTMNKKCTVKEQCDAACYQQKQFAGKCENGVCNCKISRDEENWRTYSQVVNESRHEEETRREEICSVAECQNKCGGIQRDGDCKDGVCKCFDTKQRQWRKYTDFVKDEDIPKTENLKEVSCTVDTRQMCYDKCIHNSNNLYNSGDCVDNICQCYDHTNNQWVKYREHTNETESVTEEELIEILDTCSDNGKCATVCGNEGREGGTCINRKCQCNDKEKGKELLDQVIKENRRKDICGSDIGEGHCNYRCVGLGFIKGRCNGKKCQCLENREKWVYLTPTVEEDYTISVCKVENGEDKECSRYCWRFKQSHGECKGEICRCDESNRNDEYDEIYNEIEELCEDPKRQHVDCKSKCKQLGKRNGKCQVDDSGRKCSCEDSDGNWKILRREYYYRKNGSRIDDRVRHEKDIINNQCSETECDVACYEQKQFAGKCEKDVCHCKITREEENWRTYQEIVNEQRYEEEIKRHEGTCSVDECKNKCGSMQSDGDCIDNICKCYDTKQRQWRKYTDLVEDNAKPGDPKYEACLRDTGEGNCNYLCRGVGYIQGRCSDKKCQCLTNYQKWVDLTETIENDYKKSVCKAMSPKEEDCSKYCWRFSRTSGECKDNTCTCNKNERNNDRVEIKNEIQELCEIPQRKNIDCEFKCIKLGKTNGKCEKKGSKSVCQCQERDKTWKPLNPKDYYDQDGKRKDDEEEQKRNIINRPCNTKECDVGCCRQKQFAGSCRIGTCECQITKDSNIWQRYKRVVEENEYYEERTEVFEYCSDNEKCGNVCRYEGLKGGTCVNEKCQCTDHRGKTDNLENFLNKNRHKDVLKGHTVNCTANTRQVCSDKCRHGTNNVYDSGDCVNYICQCFDRQNTQWVQYKEEEDLTIPVTDNEIYKILGNCSDNDKCTRVCGNEGWQQGSCDGGKCQCSDNVKGKEYLDVIIKENRRKVSGFCQLGIGEGHCNYRCVGLGYIKGRCHNTRCQCLDNEEKWIDLTPELQEDFAISVCKLENGEDKECSRYCWRFKQAPGECQREICRCDESKRNREDDEIVNEIEELCEDPDRQNADCKYKCEQLGKNNGRCNSDNSARECTCEDFDGNWHLLTKEDYYNKDGTRTDDRIRHEQDMITEQCSRQECDVACHEQKQFAGKCQKEVCHCKVKRESEYWRTYQEVVHEKRYEEETRRYEGTCSVTECQNKCGGIQRDGDCINGACKCYDSQQRLWKRYIDREERRDDEIGEILNKCTDDKNCAKICIRERWKEGVCTSEKCQCNDKEKGKKYLDSVIKENRRKDSDICHSDIGEGHCNYRCVGLGYIKGRCHGKKCQCLENEDRWLDLTPDLEEDFTISVCKVENGEDKECSRYCWRFKQAHGECKTEICKCDETNRNDDYDEINNEIEDLCDDQDRQSVDCKFKCQQLGKNNGKCENEISERKCVCEDLAGNWNPLVRENFYSKNGSRIDDRQQREKDIINEQCSRQDCDIACHEQKQFAGKCDKDVCHCKVIRDGDNWRTYQEIVYRERYEEKRLREGICLVVECQNKCGGIQLDGDCIDGICKCYHTKQRQWKRYSDLVEDISKPGDPKYEACLRDTGEGNCIYLCGGVGYVQGRCSDKNCQCLTKNQKWVNLNETIENEHKKSVCTAGSESKEECSKYCWRFARTSGECKDRTCTCNNQNRNNERDEIKNEIKELCEISDRGNKDCQFKCIKLGKISGICKKKDSKCYCQGPNQILKPLKSNDYYDEDGKRKDNEEGHKYNIINGPCSAKECDFGCCRQKQFAGSCRAGTCECQVTRKSKVWESYRRVIEENEYYEERTEVFDYCSDNEKCGNLCRYEGLRTGTCSNDRCQCTDHKGKTDYLENIVNENRNKEADTMEGTEVNCTMYTSKMCSDKCHYNTNNRYDSGDCVSNTCQCYDRPNNKWVQYRERDTKRSKSATDEVLDEILETCSDNEKCAQGCENEGWNDGICTDGKCKCNDDVKGREYLSNIIKENRRRDSVICRSDVGEGHCNYRCMGLGYIKGRCNGNICQCLENERGWINLTPAVEEDFTISVCKVENGEDKECSRYCWRFNQAPGECKKEICRCDESRRNDEYIEINNEIEELCEDPDRQNIDCKYRCAQLGKKSGKCEEKNSERNCICEELNGNFNPLTTKDYYHKNGSRIDDRRQHQQDVINNKCSRPECDVACHEKKQFAGKCENNICHCKITREGENWRTYQEIVNEERYEEDNKRREGTCSVNECHNKCGIIKRDGDCIDNICKCYDNKQRQWTKYTDIVESISKPGDPKHEACLRDTGEGNCDYLCRGIGHVQGRCSDKKCQCLTNNKKWVDLTDTVENDYKKSICRATNKNNEDCSKYCWRFARGTGECKDNTCSCNKNEINELDKIKNEIQEICENRGRKNTDCEYKCTELGKMNGKCENKGSKSACHCQERDKTWKPLNPNDFYNADGKRKDNEEEQKTNIINRPCSEKECDVGCCRQKQFAGSCKAGTCECQVTRDSNVWEKYKRVVEENEYYEERTVVFNKCLDNDKCGNVCRFEGMKGGSCSNDQCECSDHTGRKDYLQNILNHQHNPDCLNHKDEENCDYHCVGLGYKTGICHDKKCQCTDNELKWIDLTPELEEDFVTSACKVENGEDKECSRYCLRFKQSAGECQNEICKCDESKNILYNCSDNTACTTACEDYNWKEGKCFEAQCQCRKDNGEKKNLENIMEEGTPNDEPEGTCSIGNCKANCGRLNLEGDCINDACQCYNERHNRWEELNQLEGCRKDMGEGDCHYRCGGLGYLEGKCKQKSCKCLTKEEKWIDLVPELEDQYESKVCRNVIGQNQECSRYCWRFWKSPGDCKSRRCTCDENKENDPNTEIENEISELCENADRKNQECEYKCVQLGNVKGTCKQVKSERKCNCENRNGKLTPLTLNGYYEDGERKDNNEDIIRGPCKPSKCDSACYLEKQFAGICKDSTCQCKVTRDSENWRNYEDVIKERRHDPRQNDCSFQCNKKCVAINQRAGECEKDICQCIGYRGRDWKPYDELIKEISDNDSDESEEEIYDNCVDHDKCLQACNSQTWNKGQCVDKRCQCTDDKKPERDLEVIMKHTSSGEYESDIYYERCEDTKCNKACASESWHNGKCSKDKCECYNKDGTRKYLDEVKKNIPGQDDDKACNDKKDHDCYDKCHTLRQYTGHCKVGACECQSAHTRKIWQSYEQLVTDREVVHKVTRDTSFPAVTCTNNEYCKESCRNYTTGVCSNEECECRLEDGSWKKMWEIEEMRRVKELDEILIEELSTYCTDNAKCQLVCKSYDKPYGSCFNKVCKCQNSKDQSFTTLEDIAKVQRPKELTSKEIETMYATCTRGNTCKRMCQCYRQAYGDCNKDECYCMDNFKHTHWSSFREVVYKESHTVIRSYSEYKSYRSECSEREKKEMCLNNKDSENLCHENCRSHKQFQGKCMVSSGCYCQANENGAWRLYEDVRKQTEREKILKKLYEDCVDHNLCRAECKGVERYNGQCLENKCTCSDQTNNRQLLKDLHRMKESTEKCVEETCKENCNKLERGARCEGATCYCIDKDGHMHDYKDLKQREEIRNQHLVDKCEDNNACRLACKTYEQKGGTCVDKSCQCESHLGKSYLKDILKQHYRSDEYAQQEKLAEQVATSEMCPRLQGSQICIVRCIQLNQTAGKCTDKAVCYCQKGEKGLWRTYEEVSEIHRMADNADLCSVDNSQHAELCTKKCKATGRNEGSCSEVQNECCCLNSVGQWGRLQENDEEDSQEEHVPDNNIKISKTEEKELIKKAIQAGSITKQEATKFILCKYTRRHQSRCRNLCKGVGHRYGKCYSNVCLCKQQKGTWKRLKTKYVNLDQIAEMMKQEGEEVEEEGPMECHVRFHGRVKIHCLQNIAQDLQDQFCSQDCNKLNRPGGSCDQETQRCTCNFHSDFNS